MGPSLGPGLGPGQLTLAIDPGLGFMLDLGTVVSVETQMKHQETRELF